jgi:formate dehydrogenase iron-sulfur subunit
MKPSAEKTAIKTTLVDITKCIGCHACQVACKQWNERDGEVTQLEDYLGFQNPVALSANTLTLITFHEILDESAPGGLRTANAMRRCLHCLEPSCVSACPTTALTRREDGPVVYDSDPCIGCRYCILACPWGVPTADWDSLTPKIHKCTHCADRTDQPIPLTRNAQALNGEERSRFQETIVKPACVKACPADALVYGEREEMLTEGRRRIAKRPGGYVDHIYGEHEAGGTSVLYLSAVPFEKLGFPDVGTKPYPGFSKLALKIVPFAVMAVGGMLGATYAYFRRRARAVAAESAAAHASGGHAPHVEFEKLDHRLLTPFNFLLLALMAVGAAAFVTRFVLGLGGSTHLSDTYPWGLWIVFDLVWIALAAGAFATAGLIYVFQRKDLYGIGRSAVLIGLLSYTFVTVTLVADLGLPFHFYQLALNHPEHSAMFEVSWCVGLYVTVLLFEFLPVPLEHWGFHRTLAAWKKWSGAYVVFAASLFVFMLSRNLAYVAATAAVFGALAWIFRARDEKTFEPVLLAIAAVTLSTMHQSSLGSLYLLVPNMLAPLWWSPWMPVFFFISSIAAGAAVVILASMWIAKGWRRTVSMTALASMGQVTFWSLLAFEAFRVADLAIRGGLANALSGRIGALFVAELVVGGVLPLLLLGSAKLRAKPKVLFAGALLATVGVVLNRTNVVLFAMNFFGTMPYSRPETYSPSLVEWGVSVGLIAATIFLFGVGARLLPLLPKRAAGEAT